MSDGNFGGGATRLVIEIDSAKDPISGWLGDGVKPGRQFSGMIELISLLDAARDRVRGEREPPPPGHDLEGAG